MLRRKPQQNIVLQSRSKEPTVSLENLPHFHRFSIVKRAEMSGSERTFGGIEKNGFLRFIIGPIFISRERRYSGKGHGSNFSLSPNRDELNSMTTRRGPLSREIVRRGSRSSEAVCVFNLTILNLKTLNGVQLPTV